MYSKICFVLLSIALFCGCYSFKGISIPPDVKTYFVEDFSSRALTAPADLEQTFTEALRSKIRNNTSLNYDTDSPHIEFTGEITSYNVKSKAPVEGATTALNSLEITVKVNYLSNLNEDDDWSQNFSFFADFDSTTDLQSVQDELITEIFEQITELVFNRAFTNW